MSSLAAEQANLGPNFRQFNFLIAFSVRSLAACPYPGNTETPGLEKHPETDADTRVHLFYWLVWTGGGGGGRGGFSQDGHRDSFPSFCLHSGTRLRSEGISFFSPGNKEDAFRRARPDLRLKGNYFIEAA
jgi:hypothetical protein